MIFAPILLASLSFASDTVEPQAWEFDASVQPSFGLLLLEEYRSYLEYAPRWGFVAEAQIDHAAFGGTAQAWLAETWGSFMLTEYGFRLTAGPRHEHWGVEAGVELSTYLFEWEFSDRQRDLAVGVPLRVRAGWDWAYLTGGVTPFYGIAPERRIDWPGCDCAFLGHEFGLTMGAGTRLGPLQAWVGHERRYYVDGVFGHWSLVLGLRPIHTGKR